MTHEEYVRAIRQAALNRLTDDGARARLSQAKLTYGAGERGTRGVTYFSAWKNGEPHHHDFIEICAMGESSPIQLAGTTIHELAHSLAGSSAGHGRDWKAAAALLGLIHCEAAGQSYAREHFAPEILAVIDSLPHPTDGTPVFSDGAMFGGLPTVAKFKPCPLGIGTRGGTSRGKGSGSRLRLYQCDCGVKVRVARDDFRAHCDDCGTAFVRVEKDQVRA